MSNNNNEKYWWISLWLVLIGFYFATYVNELRISSPLSLVCGISGVLRCYTQILDLLEQKFSLFPHNPKQRILSGSRMHKTKVLPEVAKCCWCSVGVSFRPVLGLI